MADMKKLSLIFWSLTLFDGIYCDETKVNILDFGSICSYMLIFGAIIAIAVVRHFVLRFEVPISFLFFAILLGFACQTLQTYWLASGYYLPISLGTVQTLYKPMMVFSTAFCIDVHSFFRSLPQILIIGILGAVLNVAIIGFTMKLVIGQSWSYSDAWYFGSLYIATYPIEVLRWLKQATFQNKYITVLLEGEIIVSTACAVYMFEGLMGFYRGWLNQWYHHVMLVVRSIILGLPISYLSGLLGVTLMKLSFTDHSTLLTVIVAAAYTSYYVNELICNNGIISSVITGLMMGMERISLPRETEKAVTTLWRVITILLNIALLMIVGMSIPIAVSVPMDNKDYLLVFITYLMCNLGRILSFFIFLPIIKKVGYGMSFHNAIVCVWGGLKNPLLLHMALMRSEISGDHDKTKDAVFFLHNVSVYLLLLLINGSCIPIVMNILGMSELSTSRQINMSSCMKYLYETRARTIAILKMDRFLSDANWPLVTRFTALQHPYKKQNKIKNDSDSDCEDDYFLGQKFTYCTECQRNIPNEPTPKELKEMTKEARLRILKLKKMAYSRAYQNGMLSKEGLRVLQLAVDTAIDTNTENRIQIDSLKKLFNKENRCLRTVRDGLQNFFKMRDTPYKTPRKKFRHTCGKIVRHKGFKIYILCIVLLDFIHLVYVHVKGSPSLTVWLSILLAICHVIFFFSYLIEFWLNIFAYAWMHICQDGFGSYFRSPWNIEEFSVLIFSGLHMITESNEEGFLTHVSLLLIIYEILLAIRMLRFILTVLTYKLWQNCWNQVLKILGTKVDEHKAFAFEIGKNFVTAQDEILNNLPLIVDNVKIKESIGQKEKDDRTDVCKLLGLAQKYHSTVAVTVKTQIAMKAVLHALRDDIHDLKIAGWVDDIEYTKLLKSLEERLKQVDTVKFVDLPSPKSMFLNVPYIPDEEGTADYLFENIRTKKFDPGDVVIEAGQIIEGVYILITGVLHLSYTPQVQLMGHLINSGVLPIVDYIATPTESIKTYILPGNSIGELCTLTGRPYNCTIIAQTHSQVYVLGSKVIENAIAMDRDPVNGLECRMWKSIAFLKALAIMINVPAYRSYTEDKVKYVLERSFMPNLANYKLFIVNDMIQDIVLIEGLVVDFNTRDMYTAPTYIPRSVQKLMFPSKVPESFEKGIEAKLLIVPARDANEYEIMAKEEAEMMDTSSTKCLLHYIQDRIAEKTASKRKTALLDAVQRMAKLKSEVAQKRRAKSFVVS